MTVHQLERTIHLSRPLGDVFSFFSDAANLEILTPPWLKFEVVTPRPIVMQRGTLIDYRLRLRGFPIRWRSEITEWNPPYGFADEQRRGPYRFWHHEHRFVARDDGTDVVDRVQYAVSFDWVSHHFVRRDVENIFDFREQKLRELFPAV